jgi:enoyl-CoA hydratase/carnithine racemase
MTEFVEIAARGTCLEITLNRPDKKNALTGAMYARHGRRHGAAFCAGNDLQDFLSAPMTEGQPVLRFLDAIATTGKVMIAAVQGPCVGIGATLLLHCDHVVAAPSAALAFNFVKIALVPEAGSSLLLPRAVGRLKASELFLTGDPVAAQEAHTLGLVSRVVAEGEQLAAARAFADKLSLLPPAAIRQSRALIRADQAEVLACMARETAIFKAQLASPEFREAVSAFLQKRAPDFSKAS